MRALRKNVDRPQNKPQNPLGLRLNRLGLCEPPSNGEVETCFLFPVWHLSFATLEHDLYQTTRTRGSETVSSPERKALQETSPIATPAVRGSLSAALHGGRQVYVS